MNIKTKRPQSIDLLCVWAIVRLPLLIIAVYFFVPDLFTWLATVLAIHLIGTIPERLVFLALVFIVLAASFWLAKRWRSKLWQYLLPLMIALVLFLFLFTMFPGHNVIVISLFLTGVLTLNTVSGSWFVKTYSTDTGRRVSNAFFAVAIIISEFLLLKPFLLWLLMRCRGRDAVDAQANKNFTAWILPALLVSALAALFLNVYSLADFHRSLFSDPQVNLFARGDFNWLELDPESRTLYAGGHGTNHLQAYDLGALDQPPRESNVETGYAQGFAYNPVEQELYVYNQETQAVLILGATTLTLKRSMPVPQLSPGDPWIVWDKFTDSIIIVSEADEQQGIPMIVLDRLTGEVLDTRYINSGNILLHPTQSLLYMSSFHKNSDLLIYDTQQHKIVQQTPISERLDRMTFLPQKNGTDLLVTTPTESMVQKFDAETLEYKGSIPTLFGGRAIAVDPIRNLLLSGSLVTNKLEVIDLSTQQQVTEYYLGPWLRTIVVDNDVGVVYVSSHEGLFAVRYAIP